MGERLKEGLFVSFGSTCQKNVFDRSFLFEQNASISVNVC